MSLLQSRWTVSLLGTVLLAVLLWIFGPLWPPLEPVLPRIVVVQTLLVLWLVANAVLDGRRRNRAAALGAGIAADEEGRAVRGTLAETLAALGRRGGRAALAELPWYAIIGPPGAGKTTALLNAGLRFLGPKEGGPKEGGPAAVPGVGGTRLLEWWFTENAVLIDTAGRYTTQDSDAAVDRAGWDAFLALLRRTRPRQPLNGVLVAIGLPDVLGADPAERDAHAAAVNRRIAELEARLELRVPVYVLFTKADLIAGFSEFFEDLDAAGRDQVWGETFPFEAAGPPVERFVPGFRVLAERLAARMLPRLAAEERTERRPAIAGFPTQFAGLEKPLAAFLARAVGGRTLLRGVYFTSGTQEGTPIDRLTGAMARAFGLGGGAFPVPGRPDGGRSYFLGQLLRDVVFGEAMLVREPPARRRRRALVRSAGFAVLALLLAGGMAALALIAREGEAQVAALAAPLAAYEAEAAPLAADTVTGGDLRPLAVILDRARGLRGAVNDGHLPLGFDETAKLAAGADLAYRNALVFGLLPRLLWRLEAALRGEMGDPDRLYEATKVYLMLGGAGPLDPATVRAWTARDWARALPGEEELANDLLVHLDRMLAQPLPPVELDGALLAAARAGFSSVPLAVRVYANVQAAAAATPPWRPSTVLGLAGAVVFTRASGKPMTEGVPFLFTAEGYRRALLPALPRAARLVAGESWVAGRRTEYAPAELAALEQAVTALYAADLAARWDALLADLDVAPISTVPQAAQSLYILSSAESPMRALLRSIGAQLDAKPPGPGPAAPAEAFVAAAARFRPLVALTAGDGAALERTLRLVADVQQPLAKIAALPVGTALPPGGEDIGNALLADAARQPPPVNRWLTAVAAGAQAVRTGNARRRIALAFNAPGGPAAACAAALVRPPFAPSGTPLSFEEFARVFGPGGALDAFFNRELKPYVDAGTRPWKLLAGGAAPAPLGAADAAQFGRAAALREAFFPAGGPLPSFTLEAFPASARPAALSAGAASVESGRGPARATQLTWPPPPGAPLEAAVTLDGAVLLRETGPWALNRLAARGRPAPSPRPGRQLLSFDAPGGPVAFEFAVPANANPFAPGLFGDFRCPAVQ